MSRNRVPENKPLLTLRAALILLFALLTGVTAGVLTALSQHDLAQAVLVGGGALGGSLLLYDKVIGHGDS
ncbi:hypothetical protein ACWIG4_29830 [Streptomyces sp. NPDC002248]